MIPFDEIDARLKAIGKDRPWLAEVTPYSADYIRDVLAPKSTRKNVRVQTVLSNAIEAEELKKSEKQELPDRIVVEVSPETFESYNRAALAKGMTIKEWMIEMISQAAQADVKKTSE